jgi:hypothetical protein
MPSKGSDHDSFAAATGYQTIPGQEQRLSILAAPKNRFERRAKGKATKKLLSRSPPP